MNNYDIDLFTKIIENQLYKLNDMYLKNDNDSLDIYTEFKILQNMLKVLKQFGINYELGCDENGVFYLIKVENVLKKSIDNAKNK